MKVICELYDLTVRGQQGKATMPFPNSHFFLVFLFLKRVEKLKTKNIGIIIIKDSLQ